MAKTFKLCVSSKLKAKLCRSSTYSGFYYDSHASHKNESLKFIWLKQFPSILLEKSPWIGDVLKAKTPRTPRRPTHTPNHFKDIKTFIHLSKAWLLCYPRLLGDTGVRIGVPLRLPIPFKKGELWNPKTTGPQNTN